MNLISANEAIEKKNHAESCGAGTLCKDEGNGNGKPDKKRETILKAISGLEREMVILARAKLGDSFSEEEIREVWAEVISGSRQG